MRLGDPGVQRQQPPAQQRGIAVRGEGLGHQPHDRLTRQVGGNVWEAFRDQHQGVGTGFGTADIGVDQHGGQQKQPVGWRVDFHTGSRGRKN
jgi:hypothetical protein